MSIDKNELEKQFNKISSWSASTIALRVAMRAMPFLSRPFVTKSSIFDFSKQEQLHYQTIPFKNWINSESLDYILSLNMCYQTTYLAIKLQTLIDDKSDNKAAITARNHTSVVAKNIFEANREAFAIKKNMDYAYPITHSEDTETDSENAMRAVNVAEATVNAASAVDMLFLSTQIAFRVKEADGNGAGGDVFADSWKDRAREFSNKAQRKAINVALNAEIIDIQGDLEHINNHQTNTHLQLLEAPLWREGMPSETQTLWMQFQKDVLELDAGFEVWLDWYQDRLDGKPLDLELEKQWAFLSKERRSQSPAEINAYLKLLRDNHNSSQENTVTLKGTGDNVLKPQNQHSSVGNTSVCVILQQKLLPLNRVRTIFIGPGAAGKTSLIRALRGEHVKEGDQACTTGTALTDIESREIEAAADVFEHQLDGTSITVHFWDFGGQVMAHATHQFFLRSKCLYVLVLDAGDERAKRENRNANTEAEYWLEHIRAYGGNAPVMIIQGKCDLPNKVEIDLNTLQSKYTNIIGSYSVSATEAKGKYKPEFEVFARDWAEELMNLGIHGELFTPQQFTVMKAVQETAKKDDFLPFDAYNKICEEAGLEMEGAAGGNTLRDLMDKLGIIMHFHQLATLDADLLNPRWLTYGVYALLFDELTEQNHGRITMVDVIAILKKPSILTGSSHNMSYPAHRCGMIIDAMTAFRVAYRLSHDHNQIIIPSMLPEGQPDHDFDREGAIAFQFDFKGLLPRHVLPSLIVDHHKDIANIEGTDIVWQYGVLLRPEHGMNAEALVTSDIRTEQNLDIFVKGQDAADYLALLRKSVLDAIGDMPSLRMEERVRVRPDMRTDEDLQAYPGGEPHWVMYQTITTAQKRGKIEFPGGDDTYYDTAKVMRIFPAISRDPRHQIMLSYSHTDRKHIDELANSLIDKGYRVWFDKKLDASDNQGYSPGIKRAIDDAQAVLVLLSNVPEQSQWVRNEAKRATQQSKIIFLHLPNFDFEGVPLEFEHKNIREYTDMEGIEIALKSLRVHPRRG